MNVVRRSANCGIGVLLPEQGENYESC